MGLFKSAKSSSGKKVAFFLGGALLVSGSLFAVACGTDNGNAVGDDLPTPARPDGATGGEGGTTPIGDGGTTNNEGGNANVDCGDVPFLPNNANGFYCPFKDRDAGDGGRLASTCATGETCCAPNRVAGQFPPSFCANGPATACAAAADDFGSNWSAGGDGWECGDSRNCPGQQKCCLGTQADAGGNVNIGASIDPDYPKACGVLQAYKWAATKCKASCAAGTEQALCNADTECSAGQKCTPFVITVGGRYFGYCR